MTLLLFWTSGCCVASMRTNVAVIEGFEDPSFAVSQALFKPDLDAGWPGTAAIRDTISSP
ncbi:MAG: hypothetical protein LC667_10900 [Thioalkalivibrio sp.]|nr:hypothetical protein [Thioalkalivibrio sp.]